MKKVHELATLCNLKANLSFFDPSTNKLVEFITDEQASITNLGVMLDQQSNKIDVDTGRKLYFKHKTIHADDLLEIKNRDIYEADVSSESQNDMTTVNKELSSYANESQV